MRDKLPLHSLPDYNLFGLEEQSYEKSKVIVLPVPYDSTVTYRAGTREGPHAIIDASRNIELFSHEVGVDVSKIGIYTLPAMAPDLSSPLNMIARIKKEIMIILDDDKIPLMLGGEHTITVGALQAFKEKGRKMSIVHFDAHTDSRDELFGSKYMHATVISRAAELYPDIFHIGIRSIDSEYEAKVDRSHILFADQIREKGIDEIVNRISESTQKEIYITLDLDVLDPSEMPSVGTPEPDGLKFAQLAAIIKGISQQKTLVGMDVVEFCPIPYLHAPDFLAAKLTYLTLGYFLSKRIK